jgi:hypothetical protein
MGKYGKGLKYRLIVWLVLWVITSVLLRAEIGLKDYWPALIILLTIFLFPAYIFSYCVHIPIYMATENTFSDNPDPPTVLTWRKTLNFIGAVTVLLAAAVGYFFILVDLIIPIIDETGFFQQ